jgi:hypothetical protein
MVLREVRGGALGLLALLRQLRDEARLVEFSVREVGVSSGLAERSPAHVASRPAHSLRQPLALVDWKAGQ